MRPLRLPREVVLHVRTKHIQVKRVNLALQLVNDVLDSLLVRFAFL